MTERKPAALEGLKVVSMAEQYPGPLCTMILSDMGADVIQVERPGTGDPARFLGAFYECLNRNKRSVALDVRDPEQKAELLALIAGADVFLEGFRPGKLARQGLGYDDLKAIKPDLVYVSISGFGQTGPYRMRPAHDITYQGVGGALDERLRGAVDGAPPSMLLGDSASAFYATIGVLSALHARDRSGEGSYVDVSMTDTVLALQTAFIAMDDSSAAPPQADPGYAIYQTADGRWLTTSVAHEDDYWARLCADVGLDDCAGLSRPDRVARRDELVRRIGEKIAAHPFAHWEAVFEASDQMWGAAYTIADLPQDPHIQARGMLQEVVRADGVTQLVLRQPLRFSNYDNVPVRRAPVLGEHQGEGF